MLVSLTHLESAENYELDAALADEKLNGWIWCPVGRSGWHREMRQRVLEEFQNDATKRELLEAGLPRRARDLKTSKMALWCSRSNATSWNVISGRHEDAIAETLNKRIQQLLLLCIQLLGLDETPVFFVKAKCLPPVHDSIVRAVPAQRAQLGICVHMDLHGKAYINFGCQFPVLRLRLRETECGSCSARWMRSSGSAREAFRATLQRLHPEGVPRSRDDPD